MVGRRNAVCGMVSHGVCVLPTVHGNTCGTAALSAAVTAARTATTAPCSNSTAGTTKTYSSTITGNANVSIWFTYSVF